MCTSFDFASAIQNDTRAVKGLCFVENEQWTKGGTRQSCVLITPEMFARNPVFSVGEQLLQVVDFLLDSIHKPAAKSVISKISKSKWTQQVTLQLHVN